MFGALALAALATLNAERALSGKDAYIAKARQTIELVLGAREPAKSNDILDQTEPLSPGDFYNAQPGNIVRLPGGYCLEDEDPNLRSEHATFIACMQNENRLLIEAVVWPNIGQYQLGAAKIALSQEIITTEGIPDGEMEQTLQELLNEGLINEILADFGMVDTSNIDKSNGSDKSKDI